MKNQVEESLFVLNNLITLYNPKYPAAYELIANIVFQLGEIEKSESYLLRIIELGVANENTVGMLFKVYDAMGLNNNEKYIRLYSHLEKFHREQGDDKSADEYLDALNQVSLY